MKSRGMKHSNQVREFIITDEGLDLVNMYLGTNGVLIGSARETQQLSDSTGEVLRTHAMSRKDVEIERKKRGWKLRFPHYSKSLSRYRIN